MIKLKELTWENWETCAALQVKKEQSGYVTSNVNSLAEAYIAMQHDADRPITRAIYHGDTMVGFTLLYYATVEEYNYKGEDGYWIGRFMIDGEHQGKGYGRKALIKILEYLKTAPIKKSNCVYLSYRPDNAIAQRLYASLGFVETGEIFHGETVAVYDLTDTKINA